MKHGFDSRTGYLSSMKPAPVAGFSFRVHPGYNSFFGSGSKVGKFDFCGLNSIMSDFLKLMLPEGLFEYFELTKKLPKTGSTSR